MSSMMVVEVEFFESAGFKEAAAEAKAKAEMWQVAYVRYRFSEAIVFVQASSDIEDLYRQYTGGIKYIRNHEEIIWLKQNTEQEPSGQRS